MKGGFISKIGVYGQMHYRYLKENKPTAVNVIRMSGNMKSHLREMDEQAEEMHSLAEVEAFSCGFRLGVRLLIGDGVPPAKETT